MVILQGVITGDLQVNDTDMHRPFRALYCDKESALIIEKLQEHSNKLPSPTRDDIMNTSKFVWIETFANAFKQNAIINKPDGSEDNLVTSKLKTLIWQDILDFRRKTFKFTTPHLIKGVRRCHDTTRRSHKKIKRSC